MWDELGISSRTAVVILVVLYFIIKWAVKNGINQSELGKACLKNSKVENNIKDQEYSADEQF